MIKDDKNDRNKSFQYWLFLHDKKIENSKKGVIVIIKIFTN